MGQNSLKPFAGKEIGPGENVHTNELFEEYIRSKAETAYHPSCTLKMGVDNMAVVDEKLENYRELHNWITAIGFPEDRQQFKKF